MIPAICFVVSMACIGIAQGVHAKYKTRNEALKHPELWCCMVGGWGSLAVALISIALAGG